MLKIQLKILGNVKSRLRIRRFTKPHTWAWDFFHGGGSAEFWEGGSIFSRGGGSIFFRQKGGVKGWVKFFCEKFPKFTGFS